MSGITGISELSSLFSSSNSSSSMNGGGASGAFGIDIAKRAKENMEAINAAKAASAKNDSTDTENTEIPISASTPDDKSIKSLAEGLASAIEYINKKHGEQAGTAVMGLVYQKLGDGPVNEDSLGDALINGIKFIDQNFGIAEGDAFMGNINDGGLNSAINDFFDNGASERFLPLTDEVVGQIKDGIAGTAIQIKKQYGEEALGEMKGLLEELNNSLDLGYVPRIKDNLKMLDKKLEELKQNKGTEGNIPLPSSLLSGPFMSQPGGTVNTTA